MQIDIINKIDVKTLEGTSIFEELGFKEKIEVSAEHNLGIDQLKELIFFWILFWWSRSTRNCREWRKMTDFVSFHVGLKTAE